MKHHTNPSRRQFLRSSSALATVSAAATPFALNLATISAASAQTTGNDYKALVCLFMLGGNDHGNTVLATDTDSWNSYRQLRSTGSSPIALAAPGQFGGVIPIAPSTSQAGRAFALHPQLARIKNLFDSGSAAVVANVGPLIAPTTKEQYRAKSVPLPVKLFSHNDQQSTWQAYAPEGARVGWGGRMGDLLASMNSNQTFTSIGTSGSAVWLSGQDILPYRIGSNGAIAINGLDSSLFGSSSASAVLRDVLTANSSHLIEQSHTQVMRRAIDAQAAVSSAILDDEALPDVPLVEGTNSANRTAAQLRTVARIIAGRSALGARRQVFFVGMGGFDTHGAQSEKHAGLMGQLAQAIEYFQTLLADAQVDALNETTLFTASDFGRTMISNGDGTDHGWGSHHFVVGGAVQGGDIYGRFPIIGKDTEDDVGRGRLLPQVSVDQYGATLARWFGVSEGMLGDIFPNIGNFGSDGDLGFMG